MMESYRELLTYNRSLLTQNRIEKSVDRLMDVISEAASQNFGVLQELYQTTLFAHEESKNERPSFKAKIGICTTWFKMGEYGQMGEVLKELHKSLQKEDGTDDRRKGSQLLKVYALEMQMYTEAKNFEKVKQLYELALAIEQPMSDPRVMAIIHECGKKSQWAEAATEEKSQLAEAATEEKSQLAEAASGKKSQLAEVASGKKSQSAEAAIEEKSQLAEAATGEKSQLAEASY